MGTDEDYRWKGDGESPAREIELGEYQIAPYAVSNREFRNFVDDTGFGTDAERFEWSFVFHMFLPDDFPRNSRGSGHTVVAAGVWGGLGSSGWTTV